jgi:nicotinamide-nucleotide amidase
MAGRAHDDAALLELAERLGAALAARGAKVTAAESCTGGWIAAAITDVPGSSAWFDRGFVTYSNAAKRAALGVSAQTLLARGAVSEQTVLEMVDGALRESGAQFCVAVSGVAGPGGGTAEKPVGTVWIAWGAADGTRTARRFRFAGDRESVRRAAVAAALAGLVDMTEAPVSS